jgi:hypothetical protein
MIHKRIAGRLPKFLAAAGTDDPFQSRVFNDLTIYASALADELT